MERNQEQAAPVYRNAAALPHKAPVALSHKLDTAAAVPGVPRSFRQLLSRRQRLLRERRHPPAAACQLSAAVVGRQEALMVHLPTPCPSVTTIIFRFHPILSSFLLLFCLTGSTCSHTKWVFVNCSYASQTCLHSGNKGTVFGITIH